MNLEVTTLREIGQLQEDRLVNGFTQRKPSLKAANSWQQRGDGSTRHWGRQSLHSANGEISGDLYAIV